MKTYLLKAGIRQTIAKAGETNIAVAFNATDWIEEYPSGKPYLMVTGPDATRTPVTVEVSDNLITGEVPDGLLAGAGMYTYVFTWVSGGTQVESGRCECVVLGSEIAKTWVNHRTGPDWAERIFLAAEAIEQAINGVLEAREAAVEAAESVDVATADETLEYLEIEED